MKDLKGKTVLITGAARGMGLCYVRAFLDEGARVIMTDVDQQALEQAAAELPGVVPYRLDISDRDACLALAARVAAEVGPVDVLVNNAGIAMNGSVLEQTEECYRRMMDVNYFGIVWMMQAFLPYMLKRKKGNVVNVASSGGKIAAPMLGGYCATKFAVVGITDAIRQELLFKRGIRFTTVCPGYVKTGMFEGAKPPFVTRWVQPEEVAAKVVRAVKKNRVEVYVPGLIGWACGFLRGLSIPAFTTDIAFHVPGSRKSFDNMVADRGRPF